MCISMLNQFKNFCSLDMLYDTKFSSIPNKKGLYIVKAFPNKKVIFSSDTTAIREFKGKNMLYDTDELLAKFEISDKEILYIGKAGGKRNTLKQRISQFIRYGYGLAKNHRGGRAIWQVIDNKNLLLGYMECKNPEKDEKLLLEQYKLKYSVLPLGNWKIG